MNERKIHIVLGGTSGMGLSTAEKLGKMGPVLVGGRNQKRLDDALETLKAAGVEAYGKTCDISDKESLNAFVEYARTLGSIGNVVNSAAVDDGTSEQIWKINVMGTINVVDAFLPYMDHSCMVNYSSITGYFYQPDREEIAIWSDPNADDFAEKSFNYATTKDLDPRMKFMGEQFLAYIASKRFVMYYTQANAVRFGKKESQIFSVAPGCFDTPMSAKNKPEDNERIKLGTAFQRLGRPEEMADFIVKLLEPGHEYLTGCDLILDGGKSAMSMAKQLD